MPSVFDDIELPNGDARLLTKADIKARLNKLVPRAFRTLEKNLFADDEKVQVQAALGILDRTGYGPKSTVSVEDEREDLTKLTPDELRQRALNIAAQIAENNPPSEGPFEEEDKTIH